MNTFVDGLNELNCGIINGGRVGVFRMDPSHLFYIECIEMDRRWMKNNLRRTSSTREKVVYLVKYRRFFLGSGSLWGSTIPPTQPTPHKSTHSNLMCDIFGVRGFIFIHSVTNSRKCGTSSVFQNQD
jgi:hypothetical protein